MANPKEANFFFPLFEAKKVYKPTLPYLSKLKGPSKGIIITPFQNFTI